MSINHAPHNSLNSLSLTALISLIMLNVWISLHQNFLMSNIILPPNNLLQNTQIFHYSKKYVISLTHTHRSVQQYYAMAWWTVVWSQFHLHNSTLSDSELVPGHISSSSSFSHFGPHVYGTGINVSPVCYYISHDDNDAVRYRHKILSGLWNALNESHGTTSEVSMHEYISFATQWHF